MKIIYFNYIILPLFVYFNYLLMPHQKNWVHRTLDWIWDKLLVNFLIYFIATPYFFIKEKLVSTITSIYYFLVPKNYIDGKDLSVISFFQDSWHYSLSKTISIKFWAYFITGIVIFGGIGVWIEVADLVIENLKSPPAKELNFSELNGALLFYITTLLGGISSQIFLDDDIPKNIKSGSWILIILVYFFTAGVAYTQADIKSGSVYTSYDFFIICLILTIISLSIAWLVNAFNRTLDEPKINAPLGGENLGISSSPLPICDGKQSASQDPLKSNFSDLKEY